VTVDAVQMTDAVWLPIHPWPRGFVLPAVRRIKKALNPTTIKLIERYVAVLCHAFVTAGSMMTV